ncbi:C-type natriuretic peptide 1-like [Discoglossus pictus]
MTCRSFACLGVLMMLVLCKEHARAKPLTSLQTLSRLLEDNLERSFGSEELEHDRGEQVPTDSLDQQDTELQWTRNNMETVDGPQHNDISLQQLLNDPLGPSKRYRLRSKKGYSRGCFGLKLDRIGSLSGLGC